MWLARRQVWTMSLMQRGLACYVVTPAASLYTNNGASVGFASRTNSCILGSFSTGARGRAGSTGVPLHPGSVRAMATSSGAAKQKTEYVCTQCDDRSFQWSGRCRSCGAWGSLEAVVVSSGAGSGGGGSGVRVAAALTSASSPRQASFSRNAPSSLLASRRGSWVSEGIGPQSLAALSASQASAKSSWRLRLTGREGRELSRVLGGGVVPGSVILVGGEPGVGKSTLLLQLADMLCSIENEAGSEVDRKDGDEAASAPCVLYVSGEESAEQVADRATRLGLSRPDRVLVHCATRLESILEALVDARPRAVVLDSIQTVYLEDVPSSAGSVTQVRECATALLHVAKRLGVPLFLAGHVNKAGDIAGPRVLEHIVDVVLYLEGGGGSAMRMLRGIKNRYGTTDEVGLFQMEEEGLVTIEDPSAIFMASRQSSDAANSVVTVLMEGTRPLLVEIQGLCSPIPQGASHPPVRAPTGLRRERLQLILAVLGKFTSIKPWSVDVLLNVAGGLTVGETGADLAVACALASSFFGRPARPDTTVFGEVGLGGEVRPVAHSSRRANEAAKLGFSRVIVPAGSGVRLGKTAQHVQVIECKSVAQAIEAVLG